jgi:NADH-quinone oxidoreductase subunit C
VSQKLLDLLKKEFGPAILAAYSQHGDEVAVVEPSRWRDVATFLRNDPRADMNLFVDLCGVDRPHEEPRFEVVLHLYSIAKKHRLRLKARVGDADGDGAEVDSLVGVWPGANWFERETFDMMGVVFKGHPDLRRILMYPEFVGHPLRKDYPAHKAQPLIEYRTSDDAGFNIEKVAPFGTDEGMSFGRRFQQQKDN